jgi:hypothetical protein
MSEAHEQHHERLEREAADLQHKSEHLGEDIADAKQTWEAQRADEGVPGAQRPEPGDDAPDGGDAREPWPDE